MVEGVITFRSGATKNTTFVLTPRKTKYNKTILEGYNKTFSNSSKAFKVIGATDNGRFYPKTFRYNYKTRMMNESNKSEVFKIQGIIKATGSKKYGK